MSKSLSLNGPEAECIPSACLVAMLRKMAEQEGKPVEIVEVKPRRWVFWFTVLGAISIFGTGIVLNWVK